MAPQQKTFENLPGEKRERVLAEATREFADHGYHQASVNRIVDRLGIAKGSLFKYFGNKQGLFEYLFGNAVEQLKKPLKIIRETPAETDFFTRIELSLMAGADFIDAHPMLYRIYLKMQYQENFPLRDKFLSEVQTASDKYLNQLVAQGIESGQLRSDLDMEMAVFHLNSVMDRFLQSCAISMPGGKSTLHNGEREHIELKARTVSDYLRRGLGNS